MSSKHDHNTTNRYGDRPISFRVADDRIETLDELCEKYEMSRSELLRTAIDQLEVIGVEGYR